MSCHRKTSLVLWAGIFLRALLFHRPKFLRLRHSLVQYRTTVPADHIFQPVAQESIPPKGHGGRILLPADPQVIQATPGAMGDGNLRLFYSQRAALQDSRLSRRPRMPKPRSLRTKRTVARTLLWRGSSGEIFHWWQISHDLGRPLPCSRGRVSPGGKETQNAPGPGFPVRARHVEAARFYGCRRWIWQEGRS